MGFQFPHHQTNILQGQKQPLNTSWHHHRNTTRQHHQRKPVLPLHHRHHRDLPPVNQHTFHTNNITTWSTSLNYHNAEQCLWNHITQLEPWCNHQFETDLIPSINKPSRQFKCGSINPTKLWSTIPTIPTSTTHKIYQIMLCQLLEYTPLVHISTKTLLTYEKTTMLSYPKSTSTLLHETQPQYITHLWLTNHWQLPSTATRKIP